MAKPIQKGNSVATPTNYKLCMWTSIALITVTCESLYAQSRSCLAQYVNKKNVTYAGAACSAATLGYIAYRKLSTKPLTTWRQCATGTVYFYDKNKPYAELANTYVGRPIWYQGDWWRSAEDCYQSQKFDQPWQAYQIWLKQGTRPGALQKQLKRGNNPFSHRGIKRKSDQEFRRNNIELMYQILRQKFLHDAYLRELLKQTRAAMLVEDAGHNDKFFGAGHDYTGDNMLGQMLMHIREELFGITPPQSTFPGTLTPDQWQQRLLHMQKNYL